MDHTESAAKTGEFTPVTSSIDAILKTFEPLLPNTALMLAGNMTRARADALVGEGTVDMIAFECLFISNPHLIERLRND